MKRKSKSKSRLRAKSLAVRGNRAIAEAVKRQPAHRQPAHRQRRANKSISNAKSASDVMVLHDPESRLTVLMKRSTYAFLADSLRREGYTLEEFDETPSP